MSDSLKPEFITFTGADDHTDVAGMRELAAAYPIEWGILFSPKRQGTGRYPTRAKVLDFTGKGLRLSGHLCGGDARQVIGYGTSNWDGLLFDHFERAQINTADPKVQPTSIERWSDDLALRAILQCRSIFPKIRAVDVLFDASGGRGILATDWPYAPLEQFVGYAGGLNPDNVAAAVEVISQRAVRYWIDMETGVRDDQDRFDLAKCRAVCEAVYGSAA
jgi:hypothetical protein